MSRVDYCDDEEYPGQFNLWHANCLRSLRGRAGQASLRELEEALLALPNKRLVRHVVACEGDVCAVGAVLAVRRAKERGLDVAAAVDDLNREFGDRYKQAYDDTAERGEAVGMPRLVAWKVVALNDIEIDGTYAEAEGPLQQCEAWRYQGHLRGLSVWREFTPEERYAKVLAWVRAQLVAGGTPASA